MEEVEVSAQSAHESIPSDFIHNGDSLTETSIEIPHEASICDISQNSNLSTKHATESALDPSPFDDINQNHVLPTESGIESTITSSPNDSICCDIQAAASIDCSPSTSSCVPIQCENFLDKESIEERNLENENHPSEDRLQSAGETNDSSPSRPVGESDLVDVNIIQNAHDNGDINTEGKHPSPRYERLKFDSSLNDAGLSRVGRVGRKSSMERLLEEKLNTSLAIDGGEDDFFLDRRSSTSSRASISSLGSIDEDAKDAKTSRRTSIYKQKSIDAPCATRGNIIALRTEHLFKQYDKDISSHEAKPMIEINADDNTDGIVIPEKSKIEIAREAKVRELEEIKKQYHERLAQEERERYEEGRKQIATKSSGVIPAQTKAARRNRYLALTKGEAVTYSDEEDAEDGVDESLYVDKHGVPIARSGDKVEIVRSSGSISDIKNHFGKKSQWTKQQKDSVPEDVDIQKVSSARAMFKDNENKKREDVSFNRPVVKKVQDPKQLMEMRKKATYGNEDELPQDGVIKKTVIVEGVDSSKKKDALNIYKKLEKGSGENKPLNKPKARLLTDFEAQATMQGIQSLSSSASEASDVNEILVDLTVDTVSGYGSAAPCSPSSTLSEEYLSDTKDLSSRDGDLLKEKPDLTCADDSLLNVEVKKSTDDTDASAICCRELVSENTEASVPGVEYV